MTSARTTSGRVEQFRQGLEELSQSTRIPVGLLDERLRKARQVFGEVRQCHRDAKDCHMNKLLDLQVELQKMAFHAAPESARSIVGFTKGGDTKRQKLDSIGHDVNELIKKTERLKSLMIGSLEPLEKQFDETLSGLERTVRDLSQLPTDARKLKAAATDLASLAKLDVSSLRKYTDLNGVHEIVAGLDGMADTVKEVLTAAEDLLAGIDVFLQSAPDSLRDALILPFPLCCCNFAFEKGTSSLSALVNSLHERLVEPLATALRSMLHVLDELDIARTILPLETFSSDADALIDLLESIQRAGSATSAAVECVKSHCVCGGGRVLVAQK